MSIFICEQQTSRALIKPNRGYPVNLSLSLFIHIHSHVIIKYIHRNSQSFSLSFTCYSHINQNRPYARKKRFKLQKAEFFSHVITPLSVKIFLPKNLLKCEGGGGGVGGKNKGIKAPSNVCVCVWKVINNEFRCDPRENAPHFTWILNGEKIRCKKFSLLSLYT